MSTIAQIEKNIDAIKNRRWRVRFYHNNRTHWVTVSGQNSYEAEENARERVPNFWQLQQISEVLPSLKVKPPKHWVD